MENRWRKINLGSGRIVKRGEYCNIDIMPFEDNSGKQLVDLVLDIEKRKLPFEDSFIEEIIAENVLEHLGDGFIFALNECHRVLKSDGVLRGCVPVAGTREDYMDITHKRHFIIDSFKYITGTGLAKSNRPSHPRYADYGVLPWRQVELERKGNLINFVLKPRKI